LVVVAVLAGALVAVAVLAGAFVAVVLDFPVPYKFVVTKIDMQIKPTINIPPVIGLSHMTAFPVNPLNFDSQRTPARYFRCAPRMER
jgi:hypothetical protein